MQPITCYRQLFYFPALLAASVLTLSACQAPQADTRAEAAQLMDMSRQWSDIANDGDLDAVLDYWAEDAVMMVPGMPPLRGKAAIREYVGASADIPGFHISWEPLEAQVSTSGDMAYLIEQNRIAVPDSGGQTVVQYNKVITVWRKNEDGAWKNVVDMWNEQPAPDN